MKEKIKQLLGLNLPNEVIASAVGCAEEEITALLADDAFKAEVLSLRTAKLADGAARDNKYDQLEDKILDKLQEMVDGGLMGASNPVAIGKLLQILNTAKRRTTPTELAGQSQRPTVPLVLPQIIVAKYVVNGNQQVVEVDGKPLATMAASAVVKQLEARQKQEGKNVIEHKSDEARAQDRLASLTKLAHLPVHELV